MGKRRSSLYCLLVEDQATLEAGCGGAIPKGPSGGETKSGASRSGRIERLVGAEHVPDRADDRVLDRAERAAVAGQVSLFDGVADAEALALPPLLLVSVPDVPRKEILAWEKEMLGLYVSEHPLAAFQNQARYLGFVPISTLGPERTGKKARIVAQIALMRTLMTRKNETMLALELEDRRFGYPLEMVVRAAEAGWRIQETAIPYYPRTGKSKVTGTVRGTARAVRDMRRVLASITSPAATARAASAPAAVRRFAEAAGARGPPQRGGKNQRRLHAVTRALSLQRPLGSARPRLRRLRVQSLHVGHRLDSGNQGVDL